MKFTLLAAFGLAAGALSAPSFAAQVDDPTEAPIAAFTLDTPIEVLMADERAKAAVTKHFGGQDLTAHPAYDQFKTLSLNAVAPFSQGLITEEMLTNIAADLAAIK